jgi:hypothetical protein
MNTLTQQPMTRFIFSLVVFLTLALTMVLGTLTYAENDTTYVGEISDSQCAMNVHSQDRSHTVMLKMGNAGATAADCTRYCVIQKGGRYMLETKTDVYKLDDQKLAEKSAGLKVKVTGVLNTKTNVIQVHSIEEVK